MSEDHDDREELAYAHGRIRQADACLVASKHSTGPQDSGELQQFRKLDEPDWSHVFKFIGVLKGEVRGTVADDNGG